MKEESEPPRLGLGIGISLIAYLFFITSSSLVWGFPQGTPVIQMIFVQNLVSLICTIPLIWVKRFPGIGTKNIGIHLIRDFSGVASYYLYFMAIRLLSLVDATLLNYTAPFFVPLIWWIWMKEKVNIHVWWSIIFGFIGVFIILRPGSYIWDVGFAVGLAAGILSAVALCSVRLLSLHLEPTRRTLLYYFFVGSLISFPFAMMYWTPFSVNDWMRAIGIGIATACGQILLTIAYRYGTASYLSPLGYSTVIYAGLISYFLFHKPLSLRTVLGAVLIIVGGTLTYLFKKKPKSIEEAFEVPKPKEKPPL